MFPSYLSVAGAIAPFLSFPVSLTLAATLTLTCIISWFVFWPGRRVKRIQAMRASRFSPEMVPKHLDTIVIGSGSGGCACANLLAQAGQRVLLLEQHSRTGGCTHSFREQGCEWDTGLHYTSMSMAVKTERAGAVLNFMTKGQQGWTKLDDPYDEVVFPQDDTVKAGLPNRSRYNYVTGSEATIQSVMNQIDPNNLELKIKSRVWMHLCERIDAGFTALGLSRMLPTALHFLVRRRIDDLMTLASYTVWDTQYAVFNLGYTVEQLLQACPKAPFEVEPDPVLRRVKAVLTHPIGGECPSNENSSRFCALQRCGKTASAHPSI